MYQHLVKGVTLSAALLLSAGTVIAASPQAQPSQTAASGAQPAASSSASKKPAAPAKAKAARAAPVKLVDINSVDKAALMKLPGISATDADKIIAGRPYLTKTRLVTNNIVSMSAYQDIKPLTIARQKETPAPR